MAITLHNDGFENAIKLIKAGEFESVDSSWGHGQPTSTEVNNFITSHGMKEYGLFFLATNDHYSSDVKEHYVYLHGDLKKVHHSALADSLLKAEKNGDKKVVKAVQQLMDILDDNE